MREGAMKKQDHQTYEVIDVDETNKGEYCVCLEGWSDEIIEAGDRKCHWYEYMKDRGLGVKLIKDTEGVISGMIQYIPAEYAPLSGKDFYFIHCIWIHGHKKGIGDKRRVGMGTVLLEVAEEDMRERGASGIACWGVSMPIWMKASWYKKHGYEIIEKEGMRCLLWKPLKDDAVPPKWYKLSPIESPERGVVVTSIVNGICPVTNLVNVRAKEVSQEFGDDVSFREIVTQDPEVMYRWGASDALLINSKEIPLGPPLSKKKIRKTIQKQLKKVLVKR